MRRIVDVTPASHATSPLDATDDNDGAAVAAHRNAPDADPACLYGLIGDVARAGSEGTVTVTYHPKGHPGSFDRRIFVYTQLSDKMPTAILHLTGTVIASERTDGDYPYAMGALRLKQQSVRLAPERLQNERIECLNTGGKAMRPRCDEHLLPPGITFRCEPATLAPGAKGDLVIGFDPAQATHRAPAQLPLILEGPDVPPSGRTLQIRFEETE